MCRWPAYQGDPIPIEALILRRQHPLIDQSRHSRDAGADPTNCDSFGVDWYDELGGMPGMYKSIQPVWYDHNLRELVRHISSTLFFAHMRASNGIAVQETNTHPFRHGRWLFMHNG
jgi:predicted glutamine amidotransferase